MDRKWVVVVCLLVLALGLAGGLLWPTEPATEETDRGSADPAVVSREPTDAASSPSFPAGWNAAWGSPPRFTDVTSDSGVDFQHTNGMTGRYEYLELMGGGVGLFDYDSDGDLDLFLVNGNTIDGEPDANLTNRLYRNEGGWQFVDVTTSAGLHDSGYGQGCTAADYDDDGHVDLYVSNYGPNTLYRNQGDGTFREVGVQAGVAHPGWGQSVCWLDYDRDGDLDLFVQNYLEFGSTAGERAYNIVGQERIADYPSPLGFAGSADVLYQNQGDGTFRDVSTIAGISRQDGKGMGLAGVDFDGDDWPDIFIANDSMENFFYRNNGQGGFKEVGHLVGIAYNTAGVPEASMGVDIADYDHDGDWDLIVPCLLRQFFTLYRNEGQQFIDQASRSGLAQATAASTGFDAHFLDYDNDSDWDLFFTCGGVRVSEHAPPNPTYEQRYGEPDLLLANDGSGYFQNVSEFAGEHFQRRLIGRGSALGDIDNDGDLDLVISNLNGRAVLLRNDTAGGRGVVLDLIDKQGRHNPVGVVVEVQLGGTLRRYATQPQTTYLSQSDRRVHLGLGNDPRGGHLRIVWPDGQEQLLARIPQEPMVVVRQSD